MLLTPDGCQDGIAPWATETDLCCLPPQCIDPCEISCRLLWALPSGPMWDRQKAEAMEWLQSFNAAPWDLCRPLVSCDPPPCPSLAQFAIFLSQLVSQLIDDTLWKAHRESDPFTAVTTLEDWKNRFGYQDCFQSSCRPFAEFSPYEIDDGHGNPIYCPPNLPEEMLCAIDAGIVKALARSQVGGIENLCYINWIIEPLGAQLEPHCPCDPDLDGPCIEEDCCDVAFRICPTKCTMTPCGPEHCYDDPNVEPIPACVDQTCTKAIGQPDIIWPGVIAAACFIKAFLPECPSIIYDCPDSELPEDCDCLVLTEQPPFDGPPLPGCEPRDTILRNLCGIVEP